MANVIKGSACVIYPESCDINNVFDHIFPKYPCALSPVHNRDKDNKGVLKKAHYHLLFPFHLTGKDRNYISKVLSCTYFENVYDNVSYYWYLCHWSTKTDWYLPNKFWYWSADIKTSPTFDLDTTYRPESIRNLIKEVYDIIIKNNLTSYSKFIMMLLTDKRFCDDTELVEFAFKNEMKFRNFIIDLRYETAERRYL